MLSIHSDAHSTNTDAHNDTHDQDSDDDDDDSSSPSCSSVASDDSFPSLDFSLFEGDRVHDRVPARVWAS
ncbi:hypothetical protein PLICRDRAFT_514865 [Plicaturopsis crispa FD-325 SS-3]|nr:hypothetical protein PLICRDRAFT_514865 [Plicaturopsis crispa FD-325 SS-3]